MRKAFFYCRKTALTLGGCTYLMLSSMGVAFANEVTLTGHVEVQHHKKNAKAADPANVVIWLTPLDSTVSPIPIADRFPPHLRLVQKNKSFDPHVLVVPVGSLVEFPNRDPFFHNVFSLFEGKRFDLGLYEAGSTRNVHFDKPGISYIFCNIHPEMSAVVIALNTPYYAISTERGELAIPAVPPGRYILRVWSEASLPQDLSLLAREITVSENTSSLGTVRLTESQVSHAHKNKYGQDYEPSTPAGPVYQRP